MVLMRDDWQVLSSTMQTIFVTNRHLARRMESYEQQKKRVFNCFIVLVIRGEREMVEHKTLQ